MLKKIFDKFFSLKHTVGIDIGTYSIKIVELKGKELTNYAYLQTLTPAQASQATFARHGDFLNLEEAAQLIRAMLDEAQIKSKETFFSIPDFATFFTTFSLPPMKLEELKEAVKYEAPRHIPLPLSEVTLDWEHIPTSQNSIKVLLVAVPNKIIEQYRLLAHKLNLHLRALEAEVFALKRALSSSQREVKVYILMDIGHRSTTISIVDNDTIKFSYTTDFGGEEINKILKEQLNIQSAEADYIKRKFGLTQNSILRELLIPLADKLVQEVRNVINQYYVEEKKSPSKIILSGGGSLLKGLDKFLQQKLKTQVSFANPFTSLIYPQKLETVLSKLGPEFTIAVGIASRKI